MLKIGALLNLVLAVSEGMLSMNWFARAKERGGEPKYIFIGAVWLLNAVVQVLFACDLLEESAREEGVDAGEYED